MFRKHLHNHRICAIIIKNRLKGVAYMNPVSIERSVLDELVDGILAIMKDDILAIVLYGSVARGTATPESDVDIALIMKDPLSKDREDQLDDLIVDLNLKYNKVFSVIDIENSTLLKWLDSVPFYQNLEREGITLWKAA